MADVERASMPVDIVCVGFGPASAGFLHTLSKQIVDEQGNTQLESKVAPGMPLQVLCYERADDVSFGVSGVVTSGRGLKESFTEEEMAQIPMCHKVQEEEVLYLLDNIGASRRSMAMSIAEKGLKLFAKDSAFKFPWIPPFLNKHGGYVLGLGQFLQHMSNQILSTGCIQIWPATPAQSPLIQDSSVLGIRLADQGVSKSGKPEAGYMPGMDVTAALTVVGDGPVGAIGQQLNQHFGMPKGHHHRDWAVGMKYVVTLPDSSPVKPGQVIHTLGFPEPEIFGFLYGLPNNQASLGIFVPSWMENPAKNAYRYLQHWMKHPKIQKYLDGATLTSWGAKSLQEDGNQGTPQLVGDGFVRIGEGSGTTNILTNSGVDEAWTSGVLLAHSVVSLLKANKPFTQINLEDTYIKSRNASWIHTENLKAEKSRIGFQSGFIKGMMGMGLAGISKGAIKFSGEVRRPHDGVASLEQYFKTKISSEDLKNIRKEANAKGTNIYDTIMDKCGWPPIELDGKLFVSHQDALLMGGKVQAPPGYADHVTFSNSKLCESCREKRCIDMCSGQAITPSESGTPLFDREKCVHCGACLWNCTKADASNKEQSNIQFSAGTGGLHSAEN